MVKVDLVAPAGSPEMFVAACEAGADAVYVGLRGFGDTPRRRGFTVSEISSVLGLARDKKVKVHVALDSVLKEEELTGLLDLILSVARLKPDLWVVQDPGLLRLLKMVSPSIPVQAGLHFTIHNRAGIEAVHRLGADSVAVIPEVHVNDLARMVGATKLPVEVLAHGPMRYALPGQCLLSSFLDGNSANRGRCAEPYQLPFQVNGNNERPFAVRHLDTREILPQLVAAGISAIRIAGRECPIDEIEETVRDYRRILANLEAGRVEKRGDGARRRRTPGPRGSIGYYLGGKTDLVDPQARQRRGVFLGTIQQMNQDTIGITPERPFRLGDRLEICDDTGAESFSFIVKDIYLRNRRVRRGRPGEMVRIGVPRLFRKGDSVFRVNQDENETNGKVRQLLRDYEPMRLPVELELTWGSGKLKAQLTTEGYTYETSVKYTPGKEEIDMSAEGLRPHFLPPSSSPFALVSLRVNNTPQSRPNLWDLKSIATTLYRSAETEFADRRELVKREMEAAIRKLSTFSGPPEEESDRYRVHVHDVDSLRGLQAPPDVSFSLDIAPRTAERIRGALEGGKIDLSRLALVLPPWLWDGDLRDFRSHLAALVEMGVKRFILENIGEFVLFDGMDVLLQTGPRLPVYNSLAMRSWEDLGAQVISLAVEDDGENWDYLASRRGEAHPEVPLYGHPALFTSRSRPQGIHERAALRMADGPRLRLCRAPEWTEVRTWEPVSLLGYRRELSNQGFHRFCVDLSQETWSADRFASLLNAARLGEAVEGTATFNYRRGLK